MVKTHFAEILAEANLLTRKYIKQIYFNSILFGAFILILVNVMSFLLQLPIQIFLPSDQDGQVFGYGMIVTAALYIWLVFTSFNIFQMALSKLVSQHYTKEDDLNILDCLVFSIKKIWKVMGYQLFMLILFLPVIGLIYLYVGSLNTLAQKEIFRSVFSYVKNGEILAAVTQMNILVPYIFIQGLCLIMMLIFIYKSVFDFGISVLALEDLGPLRLLKRNFALIRYNIPKVFLNFMGTTLSLFAIMFYIRSSIGTVPMLIDLLFEFADTTRGIQVAAAILSIFLIVFVLLVVNAFMISSKTIISTCIYYDQRVRYEGYDLELKLNHITKNK